MVKSGFKMQLKHCFAFLLAAGTVFAQLPLKQDLKDVVAVVDGKNVTRGEVQQILFVAGPEFAAKFQANPQVALYEWFLKDHLGKLGAELKLDQQSPLKEELEALRMNYLADAYINYEMNSYEVPREAVQKFYDANVTRYQRVRVSGVFIKFKPSENAGTSTADLAAAAAAILSAGQLQRTEEQARGIATDVAKRLRAREDMAKLAQQFSEDPSSNTKGGDIGFITSASSYPQEIKAAALGLAKGSVSDPVRLSTGFYVLRCDEKGAQPLGEASPEIEVELRKAHLDEFMKALNSRLRPVIKDPSLIIQQPAPAQR
jgi:parvulin-like peptidyl-prolyl isomerase